MLPNGIPANSDDDAKCDGQDTQIQGCEISHCSVSSFFSLLHEITFFFDSRSMVVGVIGHYGRHALQIVLALMVKLILFVGDIVNVIHQHLN